MSVGAEGHDVVVGHGVCRGQRGQQVGGHGGLALDGGHAAGVAVAGDQHSGPPPARPGTGWSRGTIWFDGGVERTTTRGDGPGRAPAGRLGEVLVAGRILGGSGLPAGTTRRHPTWGLTFLTAGTGRYRDGAHDEAIGPGTLVVVHPGHPHWYGADRGGWDELFVVFDGVVFELARRRGALSPGRPLVRGLPVPAWEHRIAEFGRRPRPGSVDGRDAEVLTLLGLLLEASASTAAAPGRPRPTGSPGRCPGSSRTSASSSTSPSSPGRWGCPTRRGAAASVPRRAAAPTRTARHTGSPPRRTCSRTPGSGCATSLRPPASATSAT